MPEIRRRRMAPAGGFLLALPAWDATTTGSFANLPYRPQQGKRILVCSLPCDSTRPSPTNHVDIEKGSTMACQRDMFEPTHFDAIAKHAHNFTADYSEGVFSTRDVSELYECADTAGAGRWLGLLDWGLQERTGAQRQAPSTMGRC